MKKSTPISEIMTKEVITLNTVDSLDKAEHLFKKHHIRHIPIVNGEEVKGILSYTDLLRISFADSVDEDDDSVETVVYNMFTLEQVMAKNLVSVTSKTTIREVAQLLSKKEFHAIPVIDDKKLVGIISTTDLLNYMLEQF
ncbi:CBS domain-containing protein [uncultured Maribacter sp.]|uniref:CBS domain-containing protein n=1 Tax=uncultured Maribacter sp. TaxID=431308 RepID=UPI00260ACA87|nr:CBS domain-containing protein [uncultured Maribacter sp.]